MTTASHRAPASGSGQDRELVAFTTASVIGGEREVMRRVAEAVLDLGIPTARLERLKTAVAEAAMSAIEHGNQARPELEVAVRVTVESGRLVVRITDRGSAPLPEPAPSGPSAAARRAAGAPGSQDLDARLAGLEAPRGWALPLIEGMVDELRTAGDADHHVTELFLSLEAASGHGRPGRGDRRWPR